MENIYQSADFYTDYFKKVKNIELKTPFSESKEERHLFIGEIEFKNTIHPLQIRVEIPKTFPHHKLIFWTKSLYGYPHLIPSSKEKGSWFCLNAPFAETAEGQLDQEVARLKEWVIKQMNPHLKAVIDDPNVALALKKASAYEWENVDEMKEFRQEALLTFIGDFGKYKKNFPERRGYLTCVKNKSNRMYVLEKGADTLFKLPYILVDEFPDNMDDFLLVKKQYCWTADDCHHLFPDLFPGAVVETLTTVPSKSIPSEEAQALISKAKEKLASQVIPEEDKNCIEKTFENKQKELREKGELQGFIDININEYRDEDYLIEEIISYELFYFALGIICGDKIKWILFYTNRSHLEYTGYRKYDLGVTELGVKSLLSVHMWREEAQYITEEIFFGRGHLSSSLRDKKISIIGVGAIGSILAETLVRSGAKNLTLWDSDLVEPGNICRSGYSIEDLGNGKTIALEKKLKQISPFCSIVNKGNLWLHNDELNWPNKLRNGDFYGNINYDSQKDIVEQLENVDLIIDCTASNELLHFLSYAVPQKEVISLCITNHANDLLCLTNRDGNLFEQRKLLLAKIVQDTKNFYVEGTGCYSPTFLAANYDIAALVQLAVRDLNQYITQSELPHSTIWSYIDRGVVADRLQTFTLEGNNDIKLSICQETLLDGEDLDDANDGVIGYLLGGYSRDGKHIFVSHFISSVNAEEKLYSIFQQSSGIIDYIGDYSYSFENTDSSKEKLIGILAAKATNESINTNNPLLAVRNLDHTISFYLYINGRLEKFIEN